MKTLNIDIDYRQKKSGKEGELSNAELTVDYITFAVNKKYKDGLNGQIRRMYGRIQEKLDKGVESPKKGIELEDGEWDFIKEAVKDATFPSGLSKYISKLEDELEKPSA